MELEKRGKLSNAEKLTFGLKIFRKSIKAYTLVCFYSQYIIENSFILFYPKFKPVLREIKGENKKKSQYSLLMALGDMERKFKGSRDLLFFQKNFLSEILLLNNILIENGNFLQNSIFDETVDEVSFCLSYSLIANITSINKSVGKCWLSIRTSPQKNRNFWIRYLASCYEYTTRATQKRDKLTKYHKEKEGPVRNYGSYYDSNLQFTICPKKFQTYLNHSYEEKHKYSPIKSRLKQRINGISMKLKWRNRKRKFPYKSNNFFIKSSNPQFNDDSFLVKKYFFN
mmetsp:Transcript_16563/g.25731  ORF Transcript_16563/g.25731 Transcript_16563/m.25731 type:complete len:284 (-) Transcript_16563:974-1825(-)